jgi:hypothetical protein
MTPEQIEQLAASIDAELPNVLNATRALITELDERSADLRAALGAIPDVAVYAAQRARIAEHVASVDLLRAVAAGDVPTGKLKDMLHSYDKARRAARKAG